jgi:hypothetical protein
MKLSFKSFYLFVFIATLIPLLWGFTHYPKLLADESIYVSQGWWLAHFKQLGPYTYWYDHFPLGWLIIGIWQKLTGGPFLLGIAEYSGRLLSILLVSSTAVCIAAITRTITNSKAAAILSLVLYATSPLGLVFHRQILLENIAVFFLWLSLWILIAKSKQSNSWSIVSSLVFGLAILTKESFLFFIPAYFIGLFFQHRAHTHRNVLLLLSGITVVSALLLYPLLALLKNELFTLPGNTSAISLINTITFQMGRGNPLPWWNPQSEIQQRLSSWIYLDPILLILGFGATIFNLFTTRLSSKSAVFHLMSLSYVLFLIRGGLVLDHYIIPVIAFFVFEISYFISQVFMKKRAFSLIPLALIPIISVYNLSRALPAFTLDAVKPQREAFEYVEKHASPQDVLVFDNYFLNLRFSPDLSDRFPNTQWHSKIDTDPAIAAKTRSVDWLFMDWITKAQIDSGELPNLQHDFDSMNLVFSGTLPSHKLVNELYKNAPYVVEPIELYSASRQAQPVTTIDSADVIHKLIWIPLQSETLSPTEKQYLNQHRVSGVVIQKRNVQNSVQLQQLIQNIFQESKNFTPVIAISFEGGSDTPILWLTSINPGGLKSLSESTEMASKKAKQLTDLGFNVIMGPIIDQRLPGSVYDSLNIIPHNRLFSYAIAEAYQQGGLIPFIKWFPGNLSRSSGNTVPLSSESAIALTPTEDISGYTSFFGKNAYPNTGIMITPHTLPNDPELKPLIDAFIGTTDFSGPILAHINSYNLNPQDISALLSAGVTTFYIEDFTGSDMIENIIGSIEVDQQAVNNAVKPIRS